MSASAVGAAAATAAIQAGINVGAAGVNGLMGNLFYKRNLRANVEAQKELLDYNSPSYQMQRLQEAGLNPNLVYGSGAQFGTAGNAQAPSPDTSFNTPDLAASIVAMRQLEQQDSMLEVNKALASKYNMEAQFLGTQNSRYNEVVTQNIAESQKRIEKMASDMGVNSSTVQYQSALQSLAIADEAFRRGQIDLQTYERKVMVAQTDLYMSDKALKNAQRGYFSKLAANTAVDTLLKQVQLKYNQIMQSPALARNERTARLNQLAFDTQSRAARIGIEGSKAAQWTGFIMQQLGTAVGIGSQAAFGFGAAAHGYKALQGGFSPNGFTY